MTLPKPVRSLFYQPRHARPRPQPAPMFDHPAAHDVTWPAYQPPVRVWEPRVTAGRDVQGGRT